MPTPVSAARECLTEEAARALDEAVSVARRRSHAQTTSIHAVYAFLALPNSLLRDACTRAGGSCYPLRQQFRALDLCVGVSLDRLQSSRAIDDEPPVANSLMAAIKRSQGSQRRRPESYHLQQLHYNSGNGGSSTMSSVMKVELKYLIWSILDDPNVSRLFNQAGFQSWDIKIALLQPPVTQITSRYSRTRRPPIFLCNLPDSDPRSALNRSAVSFPFHLQEDDTDGNYGRICKVMIRKGGKNPLLVGIFASDALRSFTDSIMRGKLASLPEELSGLKVFSINKLFGESLVGRGSREKLGAELKDLEQLVGNVSGSGALLNLGDLKELVGDSITADVAGSILSQISHLLEFHKERLWLIGACATNDLYSKLSARFPGIEKDWDLQLLPVTSPSSLERNSRPSLIGSFVPFGGFFPTSSDFEHPLSNVSEPFPRVHLSNEKNEQEADANQRVGSSAIVAGQKSENLPPWLQVAALDTSRGGEATKAKDDIAESSTKISSQQEKCNDISRQLRHPQQFPTIDKQQSRPQVQIPEANRNFRDVRHSTEQQLLLNDWCSNKFSGAQTSFSTPPMASTAENIACQSRLSAECPKAWQLYKEESSNSHASQLSPIPNERYTSSISVLPLMTDLRIGTVDAVTSQEPITSKFQSHGKCVQPVSSSISSEFNGNNENVSSQLTPFSSCSNLNSQERFDIRDYEDIRQCLSEKVGWQDEAIDAVSHAVSRYRRCYGSSLNKGLWFTFVGPNRIGKRKVASAIAEILSGSQENTIFIDFCLQEISSQSNSMFKWQALNVSVEDVWGSRRVSDLIAGELKRNPNSVIFLDNVDRADFQVLQSLSDAIRTGIFRGSSGTELRISDKIFIASTTTRGNSICFPDLESLNFSEDLVLGAKSWQMQVLVENTSERHGSDVKVKITRIGKTSKPTHFNKRKLDCVSECSTVSRSSTDERTSKVKRTCLDLNLPLVESEEEIQYEDSTSEDSETWLDEFLGLVENEICFKPFNLDTLAEQIVKTISLRFETAVGSEACLEVDEDVVVQILAAQLLSNMKSVQEWVGSVLSWSFAEAKRKHRLTSQSFLKLVACEGVDVEEQVPGVCLPAKIIVK